MPPPHAFATSRTCGFVCRSCLSQLRKPQRPRTPWLIRNVTDGPSRAKSPRSKNAQPAIKYFEQTADGERTEMFDDTEEAAILREVEERIRHLEGPQFTDPLEQAKKDLYAPGGVMSLMEEMKAQMEDMPDLENLSDEDRTKLRNRLLNFDTLDIPPTSPQPKSNATPPDFFTGAVSDPTPIMNLSSSVVVNPARYPEAFRRRIQSLNNALRQASSKIEDGQKIAPEVQKQAWKSYLLCRNVLLSEPSDIPLGVWTTLWTIFSDEQRTNLDRMAHISYLGGDMIQAGIPLEIPQKFLYIEACFLERDHNAAIEVWENTKESIGDDGTQLREYWKLGIRMFCHSGQVRRALQTASFLLNTTDDIADCRVLLLIIEASLNIPQDSEKQIAWALYIRLRAILGPEMNMEDYDAVTSIFLAANQPDLALGAFKDMMLTGNKSAAVHDSTALYQEVAGIEEELDLVTINNSELQWEDSRTLAKLPAQFNNKFFFGKWIKKLIGDDELDAAKKVLDLMIDRGIFPDAKHMNGLIGALYRTGTVRNQTIAEDMAWKMIAARLQFVEQREVPSGLKEPLRAVKGVGKDGVKNLFLAPRATIETFSILVQQYRRRQMQERLVDLFHTLKKAQIPPNTVFMNQLIMVDTKSHQSQWAWDTYLSLVQTYRVQPDFETYDFLWHLMKKATDPVSKGSTRPFTSTRLLFAEMTKRASDLNRVDKMPQELYNDIILCFCLAEDQVGTAVALRALQHRFGLYPSEDTVRSVVLQLARLRHRNAAGSRPKRLDLNKATKDRIAQVTEVLVAFKDKRTEDLLEQGIEFDTLSEQEKLEESLLLLSNLLRFVYHSKMSGLDAPSVEEVSKLAAEQMGVPDCDPWAGQSEGEEPV